MEPWSQRRNHFLARPEDWRELRKDGAKAHKVLSRPKGCSPAFYCTPFACNDGKPAPWSTFRKQLPALRTAEAPDPMPSTPRPQPPAAPCVILATPSLVGVPPSSPWTRYELREPRQFVSPRMPPRPMQLESPRRSSVRPQTPPDRLLYYPPASHAKGSDHGHDPSPTPKARARRIAAQCHWMRPASSYNM